MQGLVNRRMCMKGLIKGFYGDFLYIERMENSRILYDITYYTKGGVYGKSSSRSTVKMM